MVVDTLYILLKNMRCLFGRDSLVVIRYEKCFFDEK
jgi:hypothetical protein